MTGEVPTKLRLVKCPKCRRVLPELPNVPVYECGGCGTVLQAKRPKVASEDAERVLTETVTVQKIEPENISSAKEAQNFNQVEKLPLTGHHLVETNCESTQTETQICNGEHSITDDHSSPEISKKLMHLGNNKSTPNIDEDKRVSNDTESSNGSFEELMHHGSLVSTPDTEINECLSENAKSSNGSFEELMHHVSLVSTPDAEINECVSKNAESSIGFSEDLINHGNVKPSPEFDKDECLSNEKKNLSFSGELNHLEHEEDENEAFPEQTNETNKMEVSPVVETDFKSNEDFRRSITFGSSPEDEVLNESDLNNDRASFYNLERLSSINTLDNIAALREMAESPMTRSYYGFYGSGSSCDGTDDQFPDRDFHISKMNFQEREITNGKSLLRNDDASYKMRDNIEMQGQNRYFSSSSPTKIIETFGHQPRISLNPHDNEFGYSNGNYSSDEMSMNFHLPNKREYLEVEKMELLKKVHQLQDQLNRTYISEGKQNVNFSRPVENKAHLYHDDSMYNKVDQACVQCLNHPRGEFQPDTSNILKNHSDTIKIREERLYLGKKHALPIAGGAPFLLCYGCSEVLQIPADFLLFKRRYHKLKCGSCSLILKFSLLNRTHIAKYIDHSSKDLSQIDPISVNDYDPSLCKSFPTEEAPSPIEPQFDYLKRNSSEKNKSSSKKGNMFTNFVKNLGRSSSKRSKAESSPSKIEEVTESANSPLHRLMGYQSASFFLKPDDEF